MASFCILLAGLLYAVSASLPFIVSAKTQYVVAPVIGVVTALLWAFISRSVNQAHVPYYGLAYDLVLTLVFFFVPFLFVEISFNLSNIIGLCLVLLGVALLKL